MCFPQLPAYKWAWCRRPHPQKAHRLPTRPPSPPQTPLTLASAVWATSRIFFTQSCSSSCESAATSKDQCATEAMLMEKTKSRLFLPSGRMAGRAREQSWQDVSVSQTTQPRRWLSVHPQPVLPPTHRKGDRAARPDPCSSRGRHGSERSHCWERWARAQTWVCLPCVPCPAPPCLHARHTLRPRL